MARYFLDSSALVKRYLEEAGTAHVLDLLDAAEEIHVSRLGMIEVTSAVIRRSRGGAVDPDAVEKLFPLIELEFRGAFVVMELSPAIITRSLDIVRKHGLRAADAIQLASALVASGDGPADSPFVLVSCDLELNDAAAKERLTVDNPLTPDM